MRTVAKFFVLTYAITWSAVYFVIRGTHLPGLTILIGTFAPAIVLLGVVWAVWHLPFFFMPGVDKSGQSFPVFLLQIVALSALVAWVYFRTRGSLLLTMLMHSASNQAIGIVPSTVAGAHNPWVPSKSPVAWLTLAVLWCMAGYCLVRMRARDREVQLQPA